MEEPDNLRICLVIYSGFKPEFRGIKESVESCLVLTAIARLAEGEEIVDNIEKIGTEIKKLGIEEKVSISALRDIVKGLSEKKLIEIGDQGGYTLTKKGREKRGKGDQILETWINTIKEALTEAKIEDISEEEIKKRLEENIEKLIEIVENKIMERKEDIQRYLRASHPASSIIKSMLTPKSLGDEFRTTLLNKMYEIDHEIQNVVTPSSMVYCLAKTYGIDQFKTVLEDLSKCELYLDTNVLISLFCHAQPLYEFVNESVKLLNERGVKLKYTNRTDFELEIHLDKARRQIGDLQHVLPEMRSEILQDKQISPLAIAFFRERKYKDWRHYKRRWDEEVEKKTEKYRIIKDDKNREDTFSNEHSKEISELANDILRIFSYRGSRFSRAEHDAYLIKYVSTKRKGEENEETMPIPKNWIWSFDKHFPFIEMMEQEVLVFRGRELNLYIGMIEPKLLKYELLNALKTGVSFDNSIKSEDILVTLNRFPVPPTLQVTYEKICYEFKQDIMKEKIEELEDLKNAILRSSENEGVDKDTLKKLEGNMNKVIENAKKPTEGNSNG